MPLRTLHPTSSGRNRAQIVAHRDGPNASRLHRLKTPLSSIFKTFRVRIQGAVSALSSPTTQAPHQGAQVGLGPDLSSVLQIVHRYDVGVFRVVVGERIRVVDPSNGSDVLPFRARGRVADVLSA